MSCSPRKRELLHLDALVAFRHTVYLHRHGLDKLLRLPTARPPGTLSVSDSRCRGRSTAACTNPSPHDAPRRLLLLFQRGGTAGVRSATPAEAAMASCKLKILSSGGEREAWEGNTGQKQQRGSCCRLQQWRGADAWCSLLDAYKAEPRR